MKGGVVMWFLAVVDPASLVMPSLVDWGQVVRVFAFMLVGAVLLVAGFCIAMSFTKRMLDRFAEDVGRTFSHDDWPKH
jgi:hypothetical protein